MGSAGKNTGVEANYNIVVVFGNIYIYTIKIPFENGKKKKKEYWSGLPFPSPGDLPDPGIEHESPEQQADSLPSEPPGKVNTIDRSEHEV